MISTALRPETLEGMFNNTIQIIQQNLVSISTLLGVDYTNKNRLPSNVFSTDGFPTDLYDKYHVEVKERHIYDYEFGRCMNVHMFPVHVGINIEKR